MKTCIKIDVSKVCKDIKFETKKREENVDCYYFNLGQNVSFSRIYILLVCVKKMYLNSPFSGSCMANYILARAQFSIISNLSLAMPKGTKKRVTHDSQGCQKSSCHRFVSLGTKLLLLQMTRMNACYKYNLKTYSSKIEVEQ